MFQSSPDPQGELIVYLCSGVHLSLIFQPFSKISETANFMWCLFGAGGQGGRGTGIRGAGSGGRGGKGGGEWG